MTSYGLRSHREALVLFAELERKAEEVTSAALADINFPQTDPTEKYKIFRGYLNEVGNGLGFNRSKTQELTSKLYQINAITLLSRSSSYHGGVWMLNFTPTMEQLQQQHEESARTSTRISPTKIDAALWELSGLRSRIYKMEQAQRELKNTVKTLTDRITQLEQEDLPIGTELGDFDGRDDTGTGSSLPTL